MHLQNNYAVTEDRKAVAGKQKTEESCRKTEKKLPQNRKKAAAKQRLMQSCAISAAAL